MNKAQSAHSYHLCIYYTETREKIKHPPAFPSIFWDERVMKMSRYIFYPINRSQVLQAAGEALKSRGYGVVDRPCESVTHLLLPVPSFDPGGTVKGGIPLDDILSQLHRDVTVIGGNLDHPALEGYKTIDLLQDPFYLARNAAITAHCALGLILTGLPVTLPEQEVLIIGYGRIGKCMADLLRNIGARVTVAARKETDRAMAESLGHRSITPNEWTPDQYRIIVNTVPAPVLDAAQCNSNALLLDLASSRGIIGERVNWARGLPGICTPETSGHLIAETVLRLI